MIFPDTPRHRCQEHDTLWHFTFPNTSRSDLRFVECRGIPQSRKFHEIAHFTQCASSEIPVPGAAYNNYIKLCESDLNIWKQQLEIKMWSAQLESQFKQFQISARKKFLRASTGFKTMASNAIVHKSRPWIDRKEKMALWNPWVEKHFFSPGLNVHTTLLLSLWSIASQLTAQTREWPLVI